VPRSDGMHHDRMVIRLPELLQTAACAVRKERQRAAAEQGVGSERNLREGMGQEEKVEKQEKRKVKGAQVKSGRVDGGGGLDRPRIELAEPQVPPLARVSWVVPAFLCWGRDA
jgi:hypothetical protein